METPSPVFYCRKKNPLARAIAYAVHVLKARRGTVVTAGQRILAHIETLFVDKTLFAFLFLNRHRVADGVWRSAQPHPAQIGALARSGIRAIINLRGERDCATYYLEREACRRHGVALFDVALESKRPPPREVVAILDSLFASVPRPFLMHCKSGADRTGLASALYLLLRGDGGIAAAQGHMALRYGHLAHGCAGVLDAFLAAYGAARRQTGVPFRDWVQSPAYDREAISAAHAPRPFAAWMGETLLGRE